jgi:hypothetical protein
MYDTTLVRTAPLCLTYGGCHFKEMFMPGEIELDAMPGISEQRLQELP